MRNTTLRRHALALATIALASSSVPDFAGAQPAPPTPPAPVPGPDDAVKTEARNFFYEGVELTKKREWAEALAAFEKSHQLVPRALTSLNVATSEIALGRYVRARIVLKRALSEHEASGGELAAERLAELNGKLLVVESRLVRLRVKVLPSEVALSIDGRPIVAIDSDKKVFAAGVAPPGPAERVPGESFSLVLDPGNHVFIFSGEGMKDAVSNQSFDGGEEERELVFEMNKLPARMKITSSEADAIVKVGSIDVGAAPVEVSRPAGVYPVVVQKDGFVPYEASISVKAGEETKINAVLVKESFNVAEQWWFWTSIAGALGTAAVVTYFVVRPEPEPPPYDGGSTGWVVQSKASPVDTSPTPASRSTPAPAFRMNVGALHVSATFAF
jgi:hypothetical protein